jgi:hypothetical protein
MMVIASLIEQRMETPEVIDELLNTEEKNPQKPQYSMSAEFSIFYIL